MTESIRDRFEREIAKHTMTVLHDDGLYRHLLFRRPENSIYWFELTTTPGSLTFQGDGDTFVFRRVTDMFEFFRSPTGSINPQYWAEKLVSRRDGARVYDEDRFTQIVTEMFVEYARYGGVPAGTGRALREQVLNDSDIYFEAGARDALERFEHKGFRFHDVWDLDFTDYHWWFLWACHAIVWGIAQYDAHHEAVPVAADRYTGEVSS